PKAKRLRLGEEVWLIPGHCNPTVNLHDWYVGVRRGRVEALWPITARGARTLETGAPVADKFEPLALAVLKNPRFSLTCDMALTILRATYSGVLKDNMDFSTGFADADGKLVAQGLTLPGHLGSVPTALASVLRHFDDDMAPGDVFIMNDPFDGGMHL